MQQVDFSKIAKAKMKIFGAQVRTARIRKGMKVQDVAAYFDCDPRHISSIENGNNPSIKIFIGLSILFSISVDPILFPEKEQMLSTERRQLGAELDRLDDRYVRAVTEIVHTLSDLAAESG